MVTGTSRLLRSVSAVLAKRQINQWRLIAMQTPSHKGGNSQNPVTSVLWEISKYKGSV